jgi:hypothetical protein
VKKKKIDDVMSEPSSSSTTNSIPIEVCFIFIYLIINKNYFLGNGCI